ncbi:sugar ABC transporter permease [Vallitalea pronyensis]|uniref:Sugar ABC transporter permease n=1 Tax=Vallitalea pronyensis TaxID=1348613 RepID=A0A8J8MGJ0_9FIRM|nr:sugar ABC transporter permease [Vallitalea pronyensis]QUI21184.1 sugar ABC transporter permease [Vallitalea pronyensis]
MISRIKALPYRTKKQLWGVLFVAPWLLGFIYFFVKPMIQSFIYSFSVINPSTSGMDITWIGWGNYGKALFEHVDFNRRLVESIMEVLVNLPVILIFSLLVAVLLNGKFPGRGIARAIFFIPVIITSGSVATTLSGGGEFLRGVMSESSSGSSIFQMSEFLIRSGMPHLFIDFLKSVVDTIHEVVSYSGVQILIFLSGLQAISPELYEASRIEGATSYEIFWKITLPMVSPLILTNTVFTIVELFVRSTVTETIENTAFSGSNFGLGASMAWIYFVAIGILLGIVMYILSKGVFYDE